MGASKNSLVDAAGIDSPHPPPAQSPGPCPTSYGNSPDAPLVGEPIAVWIPLRQTDVADSLIHREADASRSIRNPVVSLSPRLPWLL